MMNEGWLDVYIFWLHGIRKHSSIKKGQINSPPKQIQRDKDITTQNNLAKDTKLN